MAWWAVYSEPRRELVARDALVNKGLDVFCPFERITRRYKVARQNVYRLRTREEAVFPRYLFVDGQYASDVLRTRGVAQIVNIDGCPLEIPAQVINRLRLVSGPGGFLRAKDLTKNSFNFPGRVGDQFAFKTGNPLHGFIGRISCIERLDESGIIKAWIKMLGGEREVVVHHKAVDHILGRASAA